MEMPDINKNAILLICPTFYPITGGSETFYLDFIKFFCNNNYRVYVSACTYRFPKEELPFDKKEDLYLHLINCLNEKLLLLISKHPIIYFMFLFPFLLISSFYILMRYKNIEMIFANSFTAGIIGLVLGKLFRKPSVVITHGGLIYESSKYTRYSKLIARVYSRFNIIFAAGESFKKELSNLGIARDKIKCYIHWVDQSFFKPMDEKEAKKQLGWNGKFIILYAGRLTRQKGIIELLATAKMLSNEDILFIFIGTGELVNYLTQVEKETPNVKYLGWIPREKLPLYYSGANLVIMPSLFSFESYNRTLIEALSCGTPIIASRRGEMTSTVNSQIGMLIEPSPNELKEAILKLYSDQDLYRGMVNACRPYAQKRFSDKNANVFLEGLR